MVGLRSFLVCLAVLWVVSTPLSAEDEDYEDKLEEQIEQLNQQMEQTEDDIAEQNLENPQVEESYEQHIEQGGTLTEQEFAFMYGATGGYTQEAIDRFNKTVQDIQKKELDTLNAKQDNPQGRPDENSENPGQSVP